MANLQGPVKYKVFGNRSSFRPGSQLPLVSTDLDSVRAYQWEIHFEGLPFLEGASQNYLTLAAKQVSQTGMMTEDIVVDRLNDRVFYPGKASTDELSIVFDNLYVKKINTDLWKWFTSIYDPQTGEVTRLGGPLSNPRRSFKANKVQIIQLDNTLTPHTIMELYGVYPKAYKSAELNYSTNEFHTIEVLFRYDFMGFQGVKSAGS